MEFSEVSMCTLLTVVLYVYSLQKNRNRSEEKFRRPEQTEPGNQGDS